MSSSDRLGVLRERNRAFLMQLRQHRQKLELLRGSGQSRKREREDEDTQTDGDRGSVRAALSKPKVTFADTCKEQNTQQSISTPFLASDHREGTQIPTGTSDTFTDTHTIVHERLQTGRPHANSKSCLVDHSKKQKEAHSQVTLQSDDREELSPPDRHHLQPLLGYDWIAGVLDVEDSLTERSDEFFNDLHTFRSVHKDECVLSPQTEFSAESLSVLPLQSDKDSLETNKDTHQCTFSYRINSRLFPVPLNSKECCPVCKRHKSTHPHTAAEPALIRVSIPCSTLLPPYKYKAHRRCSFDPSDSLGLPSHCLSGWSNTGQSFLTPQSSLDLKSSLNIKHGSESLNKELEAFSAFTASKSLKSEQIPRVSLLSRHKFQHVSPRRKVGGSSYPPT